MLQAHITWKRYWTYGKWYVWKSRVYLPTYTKYVMNQKAMWIYKFWDNLGQKSGRGLAKRISCGHKVPPDMRHNFLECVHALAHCGQNRTDCVVQQQNSLQQRLMFSIRSSCHGKGLSYLWSLSHTLDKKQNCRTVTTQLSIVEGDV